MRKEGVERAVEKTSAGQVLFERGMAVVPQDARGNEIAAELKEKAPFDINYHPGREGGTLKRGIHQVMWTMPEGWHDRCKWDGCENEAVVQRLCSEHWGTRWQTGAR